jgi:DNA-binding Lrp family transcriptional regulator
MKTLSTSLMPIFRSDVQERILAVLFANPGIEFSVSDLASRVDTSLPTALRDARRLSEAGIFLIRATGNMRLVSVNREHPLYQALSEVVLYSFGPLEILGDKVAALEGLTAAYIFGSWAARYSGEQGVDPGDVDLLLVGQFDRSKAFEIALQASRQVGKEINVNNLSTDEWKTEELGFVKTLKSRLLIQIIGSTPSASAISLK